MLLERAYRKILIEGSRDNALLPLIQQYNLGMSVSEFKQVMLKKLSGAGIRNLSLGGNFYLLGAIMYYLNGDLTENTPNIIDPNAGDDIFKRDICIRLNALILMFRNHHIDSLGTSWEQPEDFGNLPLDKLLKKYKSKIDKALGITKSKTSNVSMDNSTNAGQNYTYEVITSYEQCTKYHRYTDWCITWGDQHYNGYTIEARNDEHKKAHFIIFKRNGFEEVPMVKEPEKWINDPAYRLPKPQDTYGNSLIAVLQDNGSPHPIYITSRWNHGKADEEIGRCEADHAYTTEEFLNLIGCDKSILTKVYKEWVSQAGSDMATNTKQEKMKYLRGFKYAQMQLNNGNIVENIFKDSYKVLATGKKDRVATAFVLLRESKDSDYGFVTLYDRGKLFYEDFLMKCEDMYHFNNLSSSFSYEKPFAFESNGYGSSIYIYNPKIKKFLNIGGVTAFPKYNPYVPYSCREKYLTLAMSANKIAIANIETMEAAVVADNGSPWFEFIEEIDGTSPKKKNRRDIYTYLPNIYADRFMRQYILTYDSASNEKYIFDSLAGTYSNMDRFSVAGEGFEMTTEYGKKIPGYVLLTGTTENNYSSIKRKVHSFFNIGTKTLLNVGGYNVFEEAQVVPGVAGVVPDDNTYDDIQGTSLYYDTIANKQITFNGSPFTIGNYYPGLHTLGEKHYGGGYDYNIPYAAIEEIHKSIWVIYNPIKHEFVSYNGSYMFKIGGYSDRAEGIVTAEDGTQLQLTTPEKDAEKHEYAVRVATENVKRQFNTLLEQMNRYKQIL